MQTWAVKGERLPACCSEAKEADGGRRDTERQIPRTAPDALRYTTAAAAAVVVVVVTASTELDLAVVVGFEGAVAALRPARQRPAVNWRTGYRLQPYKARQQRGQTATGGERLPSELRQDEQANTAMAAGWQACGNINVGPAG